MRFGEVARRLTGISCPIFGVSWDPGPAKVASARRVLTFLEDRRVLYAPWDVEVHAHCIASVLEVRRFLTEQLGELDDHDDDIGPHLRAMRAACRQFLRTAGEPEDRPFAFWLFIDALGELRAVFGVHVAQLSAKFGIDVEDDLASILPAEPDENDDPDDASSRRRRRT